MIVQSSEEHFLEEARGLLGQDLPSHPVPSGSVSSRGALLAAQGQGPFFSSHSPGVTALGALGHRLGHV